MLISNLVPTLLHLVALLVSPVAMALRPDDLVRGLTDDEGFDEALLIRAIKRDPASVKVVPRLDGPDQIQLLYRLARHRAVERRVCLVSGLGLMTLLVGFAIWFFSTGAHAWLPDALLWLAGR